VLLMIKCLVSKSLTRFVLQPVFRQMRGLTLGTRTAVFDAQGRILLVQHGYAEGWMFPGGGVERGETIFQSACRELLEEAGIVVDGEPVLKGICLNEANFSGDHVAVLVVRKFSQLPWKPSLEISHAEFFDVNALPETTTEGTRRRIAEILENREVTSHW
jgi:8-oxo-dGTP pyrophosphatase MutT (NUDIX family)